MLPISFAYPTGAALGVAIDRYADGLLYDFPAAAGGLGDGTFKAAPTSLIVPLPELNASVGAVAAPFLGLYQLVLATTPVAQFSDGPYRITVHDLNNANAVVGFEIANMFGGNAIVPPPNQLTAQNITDIATAVAMSVNGALPTNVQAGLTAQGYTTGRAPLLDNLDAKVSTAGASAATIQAGLTAQGYTIARAPKLDNLDAAVSSVGSALVLALAVAEGTVPSPDVNVNAAQSGAFTISGVVLFGQPLSGAWVGQRAYRPATGEYRKITAHLVTGTGAAALHALAFTGGPGSFASAPAVGETIVIL